MKENSPYKSILGLLFGLCLLYVFKRFEWIPYFLCAILLLAILFKKFVIFFDKISHQFILFMGKILSTIILIVFYYLLLFPISLISKIFSKKDNLQLKKPTISNFKETNKSFSKESFENLW